MTPEERLKSLQEWAEEQKYVRLGEGGTLPFGACGSLRAMAVSGIPKQPQAYTGPVRYVPPSHNSISIAPPSYDTVMASASGNDGAKEKTGIKKWFSKRNKEKERSRSV